MRDVEVDHGAPGFSVTSAAFEKMLEGAREASSLRRWKPVLAAGGFVPLDGFDSWVPAPDMPALCRQLVDTLPVAFGQAIDVLRRDDDGWCLEWLGETVARGFTQVVLTMPPLQAVKLLGPHRRDWAHQALRQRMLPCWTLIGIAEQRVEPPAWDVAWPRSGPLAWVIRNDRKPGRASAEGAMHWVAHATATWSETHLETAPEDVQDALVSALESVLGRAPLWRLVQVHRWRYASVVRADAHASQPFWHDAGLGLGVCGDYLGGAGVEGAWTSGDALGARIASTAPARPDPTIPFHRSFS
jgi:predicted NAD/FAD-dependent oxidoreductase